MLENILKTVLAIFEIVSVLLLIAGEIFLIGRLISKLSSSNKITTTALKLIGGLMAFLIINAPAFYFVSFPMHEKQNHSIIVILFSGAWFLFLVIYGYYNLIRDYWNSYKTRYGKA